MMIERMRAWSPMSNVRIDGEYRNDDTRSNLSDGLLLVKMLPARLPMSCFLRYRISYQSDDGTLAPHEHSLRLLIRVSSIYQSMVQSPSIFTLTGSVLTTWLPLSEMARDTKCPSPLSPRPICRKLACLISKKNRRKFEKIFQE